MSKVEWDIVVAVKQPADLKGIAPGKLPESLLRPAVGGGKLHWLAAAAWAATRYKSPPRGTGAGFKRSRQRASGMLEPHDLVLDR